MSIFGTKERVGKLKVERIYIDDVKIAGNHSFLSLMTHPVH